MTHDEKSDLIRELRAEVERLKALLGRAADALEVTSWDLIQPKSQLIAELRKAAQ